MDYKLTSSHFRSRLRRLRVTEIAPGPPRTEHEWVKDLERCSTSFPGRSFSLEGLQVVLILVALVTCKHLLNFYSVSALTDSVPRL